MSGVNIATPIETRDRDDRPLELDRERFDHAAQLLGEQQPSR